MNEIRLSNIKKFSVGWSISCLNFGITNRSKIRPLGFALENEFATFRTELTNKDKRSIFSVTNKFWFYPLPILAT